MAALKVEKGKANAVRCAREGQKRQNQSWPEPVLAGEGASVLEVAVLSGDTDFLLCQGADKGEVNG